MAWSLLLPLVLATAFAAALYAIARVLSVRGRPSGDKTAPYACGELYPPGRAPVRTQFLHYAALFLALDIVSVMLALYLGAPRGAGSPAPLALAYVLVVLLALYTALRGG